MRTPKSIAPNPRSSAFSLYPVTSCHFLLCDSGKYPEEYPVLHSIALVLRFTDFCLWDYFLNNNYLLLKANRPLSHCSHVGRITLRAEASNFTRSQLARLVAPLSFHGSAQRTSRGGKIQ